MDAKRWMAVIVFIVLCSTYFSFWAVKDTSNSLTSPWGIESGLSTDNYRDGTGGELALIRLEGTIIDAGDTYSSTGYYHASLLEAFRQAYQDPTIKGIILAVDSPGGGVYECDEVYRTIRELQQQYSKPMVVSMGNVAASAAYYISMTADELYANRMSLTGSIGVISSYMNMAQLADNLGIEVDVYKSGAVKDMNSGWREPTPEERSINQGLIDEYYGYFVDVVVEGRNMERTRVLELADGRVYTASQALDNGLIDAIGDLDAAIDRTAELANIKNPTVREYHYVNNLWGWNYFSWMQGDWKTQRLQEFLFKELSTPRPLYLYSQGAM